MISLLCENQKMFCSLLTFYRFGRKEYVENHRGIEPLVKHLCTVYAHLPV